MIVDTARLQPEHVRRYVDNTPDPEPEDVQAHLIGGLPESEVAARSDDFTKFGFRSETLFQPDRPGYLEFKESVASKADIKGIIDRDPSVVQTLDDPPKCSGRNGGA